ncbi:hypothetical protein [Streptomyces violaceusniger]|nr:hypothetical protein [Streptomyces violaceusniger]
MHLTDPVRHTPNAACRLGLEAVQLLARMTRVVLDVDGVKDLGDE